MNILVIPMFAFALSAQADEQGVSPGITQPVQERTVPWEDLDGIIEPYRTVHLSAPVEGILETVSADRGDYVKKGECMGTLESSVEKAALKITEARTEMMANILRQRAKLEYHARKLEQEEQLFKKGIHSADERNQSRTEKLMAEAGLKEAQENLHLAKLEQARAEAALKLRTIRSPLNGVVIERHLSPGELVTRQYDSKVFTIAQIEPLRVEVMVPAALHSRIAAGMKATVTPEVYGDVPLTGAVETVDPVLDAASGTFRVRLTMPNQARRLPPGLKCKVTFPLESEGAESSSPSEPPDVQDNQRRSDHVAPPN